MDNAKTGTEDLSALTYEDAVRQLEQTVGQLESGEITLDESMALFRRGTVLAAVCASKLAEIEKQITQLIEKPDGTLIEKPFGEEA
ncbi:MAG TPA: exodeoxyribonuclease VII small subunit [Clostridiales bacterium]|nr:exodeoxyribonuclease VII small subunit [Clostridiales bacterium]